MVLPLAELTVKTQQTPKPAAHEPLLDPPLEEHSLKLDYGCVVLPWHFEFYILKCKNLKCKNFFDWFSR